MVDEKTKKSQPEEPKKPEEKYKLGEIIGAILKNISVAQHISNKFSARLSRRYRQNDLLRYFPVPNAAVQEFDLGVHFAVLDVFEDTRPVEDFVVAADEAFRRGTEQLAETVLQRVSDFLGKQKVASVEPGRIQVLSKNLHAPRFLDYVQRRLLQALADREEYLVDDQRRLNKDEAARVLAEAIEARVLGHRHLAPLFRADSKLTADVRKICREDISKALDRIQTLLHRVRLTPCLDLNVVAGSDELAVLPENAVFNVQLKVDMRNYKWVIAEEKEGESEEETEEHKILADYLVRED